MMSPRNVDTFSKFEGRGFMPKKSPMTQDFFPASIGMIGVTVFAKDNQSKCS